MMDQTSSNGPDEAVDRLKADIGRKDDVIGSHILTRPIILGDLTLASPTTQTTIGANGAATALTANPVGYVTVMIGDTPYQIPYFNLA